MFTIDQSTYDNSSRSASYWSGACMQARAPTRGPKQVHLRHRGSQSLAPKPADRPRRAMPGEQTSAHLRAAAADDDPAPDDAAAERTALLRPPAPSVALPGSITGASQLRSHSAASFSIDGEGGGHDHDAGSLDGLPDSEDDGAHSKPPGLDVVAQLSLLGVAFIWGTYTPALRFLYQTPGPPSAAVLTGVRSTLQALTLVLPSLLVGEALPAVAASLQTSGNAPSARESAAGAAAWAAPTFADLAAPRDIRPTCASADPRLRWYAQAAMCNGHSITLRSRPTDSGPIQSILASPTPK